MLKISKTRQFKRTVKVQIPSQTEPDKFEDGQFVAVFHALNRKEIDEFQANKPDDRTFLRKILVGVEGLGDEEGNPLAAADARDAVIEDLTLCIAAVEAFNANYSKAKEGNSPSSGAGA